LRNRNSKPRFQNDKGTHNAKTYINATMATYPLYQAISSVEDLVTTVRDNAQALYDEMVAVHKYYLSLEKRAADLDIRVADLAAESQQIQATQQGLEDQLGIALVNGVEKDEQIANLERDLLHTNRGTYARNSPAHPDPDVFTGENRALCSTTSFPIFVLSSI
jgi:hypothetical protein